MDLEGFNDLPAGSSIYDPTDFTFNAILNDVDNKWFVKATRSARWMDLVGDFSGNEPFIIDGEALLCAVLDDVLLSIGKEDGTFQILHAYHILETMLNNVKRRSENFDIIFWHSQRHLAIQATSPGFKVASRVLARSMLFRHLVANLPFSLHVFNDLQDPAWSRYAASNKPMFVMTNAGGLCNKDTDDFQAASILSQRLLLLGLLSKPCGISVALLNGAEYRDSKILSFVYEPVDNAVLQRSLCGMSQAAEKALQLALSGFENTEYRLRVSSGTSKQGDDLLSEIFCGHGHNIMTLVGQEVPAELVFIFVVHTLLLPTLNARERAQVYPGLCPKLIALIRDKFLQPFFLTAADLLATHAYPFDIDGTIFARLLVAAILGPSGLSTCIGPSLYRKGQDLWSALQGPPLDFERFSIHYPLPSTNKSYLLDQHRISEVPKLLQFSNPVFDESFSELQLPGQILDENIHVRNFEMGTPIPDDRHWHSGEMILGSWNHGNPHIRHLDAFTQKRRKRRDQIFMSLMQKQAASLTGASGAILHQVVITPVGHLKSLTLSSSQTVMKRHQSKKVCNLSSKEKLVKRIKEEKDVQTNATLILKWKEHLSSISNLTLSEKSSAMETFSRNRQIVSPTIALEVQLFRLHLELKTWMEDPEKDTSLKRDTYSVSVMRMVNAISKTKVMTLSAKKALTSVLDALGFHGYACNIFSNFASLDELPLNFSFIKLIHSKTNAPRYPFMSIREHPIDWQLRLFGQYMDRSMDGSPDRRVSFEPDAWQKRVLDGIDQNKSLLVVAPTSSGKTFISFYAMEKVLRESDSGVLIYIAPTKALVTQIAAEVYARFSKDLNGKSCWAIHTRDYRIHDPHSCQILVTVPEMLAIMLLSPPLARKWVPRIKRIVLDEIHCFGQQDSGAVWEQIILLAPCPIIGLSATIGAPTDFSEWLGSVQKAHGFEYEFIEHNHRYSHLRKFFYRIDGKGTLSSLDEHEPTGRSRFLHPIGLLSFGPRSLPADLALEAQDTQTLFQAIQSVKQDIQFNIESLNPKSFFSASRLLRQKDIILYESSLKAVLIELMEKYDPRDVFNPLGRIIQTLQDPIVFKHDLTPQNDIPPTDSFKNDLLVLLADLFAKNELPAILFNFDRTSCEVMAQFLVENLVKAEKEWRSSNPQWIRKMYEWKRWIAQTKARERALSRNKKTSDGVERECHYQDSAEPSWLSSFEPDDPSPEFSFAGNRISYSKSNLEEDINDLRWTNSPEWAFHALRRGIAVHHAGMFKGYRGLVESLFRRGFIRVIIATGTLALGINAPAKTCVFCGDSPYLTALMYRQCAGRAGRRGFDLRGNVIFYGLPLDRVQRLTLSRLPTLGGSFPLTSTMVLRLFSLLDGSKNSDFAISAIRSLMSLPHITLNSSIGRDHLLHHLRFSIEYLRRSRLLDNSGKPINLSAIATHLFYHEPGNFALVALMRSGVLHDICASTTSPEEAKWQFMIIMCNLFGRRYLSNLFTKESKIEELTRKFPSIIVLPPLPRNAQRVLEQHDEEILTIFRGYSSAFAIRHRDRIGPDDTLPISGIHFRGLIENQSSPFRILLRDNSIQGIVRSAFAGNSGHGDTFKNVTELANSSRAGLDLNDHAIPSMSEFTVDRRSTTLEHRLNAHILDFYTHGQVNVLSEANCIRKADAWFLLQDFSLTLKTVKAGLEQILEAYSEAASKTTELEVASDNSSELYEYGNLEEGDLSEGGEDNSAMKKENFGRPKNVTPANWHLYTVVRDVTDEFDEKFRAMWA